MSTYDIIRKSHFVIVTIFYLIYLVKTILLLANKKDSLAGFSRKTKVLEMIVSFLFLATGIYLMTQVPEIKTALIIKITLVFLSIPLAVVGFRRGNKALAILSFLCLTIAFGLAEMSAHQNKAKVSYNDIGTGAGGTLNGQQMYIDNCAKCHGLDGKAGIAGAKDISKTEMSTDAISEIITKGRNAMPATVGLTPEETKAISQYVNDNIKGK
jgi:cytochrome c5